MRRRTIFLLFVLGCALALVGLLTPRQADATPTRQTDDQLARGRYLATVASCGGCHTPYADEFYPPDTPEKSQKLAFEAETALNLDLWLAGGRPFNLGPAGIIYSSNLTSDEETGLGAWTDEEIKTAITKGLTRDGRALHPMMPYTRYAEMAESDLEALIAYLRSIPPIHNEVEPPANTPPAAPTSDERPATPPDGSDVIELGEYLTRAVLSCEHCHTQIDPITGAPLLELHLAGGQPYEGPWGIVYSANLTPHPTAGLGKWSREEITRALIGGVDPTGRRLVLMPWEVYRELTVTDREAVVSYLMQAVPPVDNPVPENSFAEGYERYVGGGPVTASDADDEEENGLSMPLMAAIVVFILAAVGGALIVVKRSKQKPTPKS